MIKYTCNQQNGYIVMSNNHLYQTITSQRSREECIRLQALLNDRNESLHIAEQQLQIAEQKLIDSPSQLKQAHIVMSLFMAFAVLVIIAMAFGGAA